MAAIKATYFYQLGSGGWTEVFYFTAETPLLAEQPAANVGDAFKPLLSADTKYLGYRLSDEAISGDSLVNFQPGGGASATGQITGDADLQSVGWLARASAGTLYRRQVWLRGMPDDFVQYRDDYNAVVPAFLDKLTRNLRQSLRTNGAQIRAISKDAAVTLPKDIISVSTTAGNYFLLTVIAHGLTNQQQVRIKGVVGQGTTGVNGIHRVTALTVDTFSIPVVAANPTGIIYLGGGKVYRRVISYQNINDLVLVRPASKRVGRAPFVPRGRRPARR